MRRKLLRSKIHRATVTEANLDYVGSISIPLELMQAADIVPHEAINVWNVTRGTRLETYAIEGMSHSGDICINGAAAHLVKPGDIVILACFAEFDEIEARRYEPKVVFVDERNQIINSQAAVCKVA